MLASMVIARQPTLFYGHYGRMAGLNLITNIYSNRQSKLHGRHFQLSQQPNHCNEHSLSQGHIVSGKTGWQTRKILRPPKRTTGPDRPPIMESILGRPPHNGYRVEGYHGQFYQATLLTSELPITLVTIHNIIFFYAFTRHRRTNPVRIVTLPFPMGGISRFCMGSQPWAISCSPVSLGGRTD